MAKSSASTLLPVLGLGRKRLKLLCDCLDSWEEVVGSEEVVVAAGTEEEVCVNGSTREAVACERVSPGRKSI